jgi:hypothetical protein
MLAQHMRQQHGVVGERLLASQVPGVHRPAVGPCDNEAGLSISDSGIKLAQHGHSRQRLLPCQGPGTHCAGVGSCDDEAGLSMSLGRHARAARHSLPSSCHAKAPHRPQDSSPGADGMAVQAAGT